MKRLGLALLVLTLVSGCGVEVLTTTAVQGDLQAQQMQAMKGQVQNAAEQTGRINIEHAIQTFKAEKGNNPVTLEELVPDFLPVLPKHADGTPYGYDPVTGTLLSGSAGAVTPQDQQTMQAVRDAINRYGTAVGYYPGTLDALYPTYLSQVPRTSAGEQFLYNNQNGVVTHPRQGAVAAPAAAPTAATTAPAGGPGGTGPMGEVMTGVGVQQQLNNMNNSGASSAQGYMNRSLQQSTGGQNNQQNKAMDQLGL